jgi:hypothetical protein
MLYSNTKKLNSVIKKVLKKNRLLYGRDGLN